MSNRRNESPGGKPLPKNFVVASKIPIDHRQTDTLASSATRMELIQAGRPQGVP